jgi:hypothetical protein
MIEGHPITSRSVHVPSEALDLIKPKTILFLRVNLALGKMEARNEASTIYSQIHPL